MLPSYPESTRRAFARNVLRNALRLTRGENLLIESWSATLPWAVSLSLEAQALGARPLLSVKDEEAYWRSVREAPENQLGRVGAHEWAALQSSDAYVYLNGPLDAAREEGLPPAALRRAQSNDHELMRVIQKYGVRSVRWDLGRTHELWARRYRVDLRRWRRELVEAALVDPRGMREDGRRLAAHLRRGRELTISHSNGTRLDLRLAHRRPRVDDGIVDAEDVRTGNVMMVMPAGVTSVTVNEPYAEGVFVSNATGVMYTKDQEIPLPPGRWSFEGGKLRHADCRRDGARVRRELANVRHAPVRAGQISIGLNPRLSTIPLLFDQERGAITLEIGRNAHLGGRSRTPHLITYLALRGGNLEIDGHPLVDQGRLVGT